MRGPFTAPETKRCVIYCRVSSHEQGSNHSLPTQEAACRSHAIAQGWTIVAIELEQHSGADLQGREGLQRVLRLLEDGAADVLLAYSTDRLSREQLHIGVILDRVLRAGASLQFVTEDFENSPVGKFLLSARTFAAELELAKIAERTQRGRRARVTSGKPLVSPRAPYGYHWNHDKSGYVLDPLTAPIVREIFDWALQGVSLRGIGTRLHERGICSPSGNARWTAAVIRELLLRPVYSGDAVAFAQRYTRRPQGGQTRRVTRPEERMQVPGVAPAIVTVEEQVAVQARLATNKQTSVRNNRHPESALLRAGFIRCGYCGWVMAVRNPLASEAGYSASYVCNSRSLRVHECPQPRISTSMIDGPVWERIAEVLRDPAIIAHEVATHRHDGALDQELAALHERIARVVNKQTRVAQAIAEVDDAVVAAPLYAELKTLAASKQQLESEEHALQQRIADAGADEARLQTLADWCARVSINLEDLTYGEKRLALEALGAQVRVWRKGAVDEQGTSVPRWTLSIDPFGADPSIVYGSTQ
jgi:site-specific DNA recombinase